MRMIQLIIMKLFHIKWSDIIMQDELERKKDEKEWENIQEILTRP